MMRRNTIDFNHKRTSSIEDAGVGLLLLRFGPEGFHLISNSRIIGG
jgi:hypothetical protein